MNMTVKELKIILEKLPDDMNVIIPVIDEDDINKIHGFRYIRTAGILNETTEEYPALCLNAASATSNIEGQLKYSGYKTQVTCTKLLYSNI